LVVAGDASLSNSQTEGEAQNIVMSALAVAFDAWWSLVVT
jgi:hypothetical protein